MVAQPLAGHLQEGGRHLKLSTCQLISFACRIRQNILYYELNMVCMVGRHLRWVANRLVVLCECCGQASGPFLPGTNAYHTEYRIYH